MYEVSNLKRSEHDFQAHLEPFPLIHETGSMITDFCHNRERVKTATYDTKDIPALIQLLSRPLTLAHLHGLQIQI